MEFVEDVDFWNEALSGYSEFNLTDSESEKEAAMAIFALKLEAKPVWLQVTMYMRSEGHVVSVKGRDLSRSEQERWQRIIKEKETELEGTEYVSVFVAAGISSIMSVVFHSTTYCRIWPPCYTTYL